MSVLVPRGTKAEGRRLPEASRLASTTRSDHLPPYFAQHEHGAHRLVLHSERNTDRDNSSLHTPIDPPPMPSSAAHVTAVAMDSARAAAFMSVPRSQCDVVETSEDLGDTHHYKRVKLTDCEREDCPLSIFYVPPPRT